MDAPRFEYLESAQLLDWIIANPGHAALEAARGEFLRRTERPREPSAIMERAIRGLRAAGQHDLADWLHIVSERNLQPSALTEILSWCLHAVNAESVNRSPHAD